MVFSATPCLLVSLACDVREYFVLEYATYLINQQHLWRLGADYFLTCPVFGRSYLEHHLDSLALGSERNVQKILAFCRGLLFFFSIVKAILTVLSSSLEHHFDDLYLSINNNMGELKERQGMNGQAIEYFLEAQQLIKVERIVDRILQDYWTKGKLNASDVVQNLPQSGEVTDKLIFLKRYGDFHGHYASKDFSKAARVLVEILTINPAPKNFWPTVLVDAIPLLEAEDVLFSTSDTHELMRCLEEVLTSSRRGDFMRGAKEQELELVRLALVRNLARAMM